MVTLRYRTSNLPVITYIIIERSQRTHQKENPLRTFLHFIRKPRATKPRAYRPTTHRHVCTYIVLLPGHLFLILALRAAYSLLEGRIDTERAPHLSADVYRSTLSISRTASSSSTYVHAFACKLDVRARPPLWRIQVYIGCLALLWEITDRYN